MILVTGGASVNKSDIILDWLGQCDEPVIHYDKLVDASANNNLTRLRHDSRHISRHIFVQGNICDAEHVTRLLESLKPRAILNFAAESRSDRSRHVVERSIVTNDGNSGSGSGSDNGNESESDKDTFSLLKTVRTYWSNLPEPERAHFRFLHITNDGVSDALSFWSDQAIGITWRKQKAPLPYAKEKNKCLFSEVFG